MEVGEERVVIPLSRVKIVLLIGGALLFVAAGVWLFFLAEDFLWPPPHYVMGASLAAVGFFGLCAVYGARKLFDLAPGLVLDREGMIDNSSGIAAGRVTWSEIREIRVVTVNKQRILGLWVDEPEKYLRRGGAVSRFFTRMSAAMYGTPVFLSSNALRVNFDELERLIREFHRRSEDARVRSSSPSPPQGSRTSSRTSPRSGARSRATSS